jgi:hypothetical protein
MYRQYDLQQFVLDDGVKRDRRITAWLWSNRKLALGAYALACRPSRRRRTRAGASAAWRKIGKPHASRATLPVRQVQGRLGG